MKHIDTLSILLAVLGILIRWLLNLASARFKVIKKRGDIFDWAFYFETNFVTMLLSVLCTIALLLLIPIGLDYIGAGESWSPLIAIGCGMSNLEIIKLIKDKLEKQAEERIGKTDKKEENESI